MSHALPALWRLYFVMVGLNILFQILSDMTAGYIVTVYGVTVSVTVFYFPMTYIISDIMVEIYGFRRARQALLLTLACSIAVGGILQLILLLPAPDNMAATAAAYKTVFGMVPQVLFAGWCAVFAGDMVNNILMVKIRKLMGEKWLWLRTIVSTIVGQLVNTAVFYVGALAGFLTTEQLVQGILTASLLKIGVEVVLTPVTCFVIQKLKTLAI